MNTKAKEDVAIMMGYGGFGGVGESFGGGFGMGILGWIIQIVLIIAIIYFVVYLVRRYLPANTNGFSSSQRALDILEERYAKGEISEEEFNRIKATLKSK